MFPIFQSNTSVSIRLSFYSYNNATIVDDNDNQDDHYDDGGSGVDDNK